MQGIEPETFGPGEGLESLMVRMRAREKWLIGEVTRLKELEDERAMLSKMIFAYEGGSG